VNEQLLPEHVGVAFATAVVQTFPHEPQLSGSLVRSEQAPLHAVGSVGGHDVAQP
jgi:hypothetical protein